MDAATSATAGRLVSCLEQLIAADTTTADRVALDRLIETSQRLRNFLDAVDVELAARAEKLAELGAVESAADVLANHGRCSKRDARRIAARARACAAVPGLADALASGAATGGHVDSLVSATSGLDADATAELADHAERVLDAASRLPVEQFAREVQSLADRLGRGPGESRQQRLHRRRCVKRWTDHTTGMLVTHLELAAEDDAKVWAAIHAGLAAEQQRTADDDDDRTLDQQLADVAVGLICGAEAVEPRVPEVSVLIDLDTLRDGPHGATVSETSGGEALDPETIRRLGCDGDLVGVLLNDSGVPLAVGRTRRLATKEQRQALRAMYRTCAFPGCTTSVEWCRIHHVEWWTRDHGGTDLDNMLPLCAVHHHLVHDGGWRLELHADRTLTVYRRDGSVFSADQTADRQPRRRRHAGLTAEHVAAGLAEALELAVARNRAHSPP